MFDESVPDDEVTTLRRTVRQLEQALESRIVIEQAKGIVAYRDRIPVEVAFERLRRAARSQRLSIRSLAAEVVRSHEATAGVSLR